MTTSQQPPRVASLTWGVKQSFRNYVAAAGGVIEVDGGGSRTSDGEFIFHAAPDSDLAFDANGALSGQGVFAGEVRFTAHGGMLSVRLAELRLDLSATGAALSIAERTYRLDVARVDLAAAALGVGGQLILPTTVTMDGYQWLGDHYPPGTVLDPVRLSVGVAPGS